MKTKTKAAKRMPSKFWMTVTQQHLDKAVEQHLAGEVLTKSCIIVQALKSKFRGRVCSAGFSTATVGVFGKGTDYSFDALGQKLVSLFDGGPRTRSEIPALLPAPVLCHRIKKGATAHSS